MMMEKQRYEIVNQKLGSGNYGVTKLAKNTKTGELVAIKYIPRGHKVSYFYFSQIFNIKYCSFFLNP
jgi:serine/threonine-protein kinase SRK2